MAYLNARLLNWKLAQIEERRRIRERRAAPRSWRVDELTTEAEIVDMADQLLAEFHGEGKE